MCFPLAVLEITEVRIKRDPARQLSKQTLMGKIDFQFSPNLSRCGGDTPSVPLMLFPTSCNK